MTNPTMTRITIPVTTHPTVLTGSSAASRALGPPETAPSSNPAVNGGGSFTPGIPESPTLGMSLPPTLPILPVQPEAPTRDAHSCALACHSFVAFSDDCDQSEPEA